MKRNTTYRIISVIFMAVILLTMMSITVYAEAPQERKPEVSTFDELSGKTISMLTGAPFEELISSKVPDVKEFTYYSTSSDMALALTSGKTDAFFTEYGCRRAVCKQKFLSGTVPGTAEESGVRHRFF